MTLPEGWVEATIGDVATIRGEKADPGALGDIPFIGLEHIEPHTSRLIAEGKASDVRSAVACFRAGDILFGRLRPYLNKVIEAPFDGCASAEIIPFAPADDVEPSLLRRLMMSPDFLAFTASLDRGDRPRVNGEDIARYSVWLPPTAEQRRIVAKLDALTARLARARAELGRVLILTQRMRDVARATAYSGDLTRDVRRGADPDWPMHPLRAVARIVTGGTPPTSQKHLFFGGDLPFFKPTDLDAGYRVENSREMLTKAGAARARTAPAGSTLVTCIGATIAKTGFARVDCAFNQQINAAIPLWGRADPRWLYWFISSPLFRAAIIDNSSATTLPIINKGRFQELLLPVPPIEEQVVIADRLEAAFARADRLESEAARARALLDRLEAAILAKAFRGELVPQDPEDEPASVLLDRLRAQRAAVPKPKRGRRAAKAAQTDACGA